MEKFVLEQGSRSSMYGGFVVDSRTLYDTYKEAYEAYDKIIKDAYGDKTEDEMDELRTCCEGLCCGDANYLDDWTDGEDDIYLHIYSVVEPKKED